MSHMPCVFCEIVGGRAPAQVIEQDDLALCLLDINPFAEGHCLVLPRRHVPWWQDMNDAEVSAVFQMAKRVANRLRDAYACEFVCMYARGRRIPHTHIFLVPTTKGDVLDLFFNDLEKVQESSVTLAALRNRESLVAAARKIRGDEE
jgi:histidine triad (HIT) family protein